MRAWILGGRGMLGRAVVKTLAARGIEAVASGREVDITDAGALRAHAHAHAPSHIINCAAMTAVDLCETQQEEAMRINARGPAALARLAAERALPVLHVSTDYVFAGSATSPYLEEGPLDPQTAYGRSKLAGERGFWQALGRAAPGYVVRTAWLFGHEGKNFVSTMLQLMRERARVQVVCDQVGSPTSCADLAQAMCDLMGLHVDAGKRPATPGTYHFANAGAVSWHELASTTLRLAREANLPLLCEHVDAVTSEAFVRPAPRPAYSVLATSKLAAALQSPPRPYEQALRDYIFAQ